MSIEECISRHPAGKKLVEVAALQERERIIKLLEVLNLCDCDPDDGQAKHYRCDASQGLLPSEVIALIKGQEHCVCRPEGQCLYHKALARVEGENMKAIRADRNSDIAQQEYTDLSNPLIKGENK